MLSPTQTTTIISTIIDHQRLIIGPLADQQARKVAGITITDGGSITVKTKDPASILVDLVRSYEHLFGRASVEACKDALRETQISVPSDDLPDILR